MDVSQAEGIVKVNQTIPDSYPATFIFTDNQSIRLEAISPPGYYFTNWSGDLSNTYNPVITMLDCNESITANFSPIMHTLLINVDGSGSSSPAAGEHSYTEGTVVSISATPDEGWQFDGWSGDINEPDLTTVPVIMDFDKTVTVNFSEVKPGLWLITGIIAAIVIVGAVIWLLVGKHNGINNIFIRYFGILKRKKRS